MADVIRELDADTPVRGRRLSIPIAAVAGVLAIAVAIVRFHHAAPTPPDLATATCRLGASVPIANAPDTATLHAATCGGDIAVTASSPDGALHAITRLDGPVALAPPAGRAAGSRGAVPVCGDGELRVVFWRSDPGLALELRPFVAGIVKPVDDPCDERDRFCDRSYTVAPQTDCALAVDVPLSASMLACVAADPAATALAFVQLGTGSGGLERSLSTTRPASVALGVTAVDDAVAIVVRDASQIRLEWKLFHGANQYLTLHTGDVGEPALVPIDRDVVVVWPERVGGRWLLHATRVGLHHDAVAVPTGDAPASPARPSVVAYAGGVAIAWSDGTALRVGIGPDLTEAIARATVVARDVTGAELAAGGDALVAIWRTPHGPELAAIECR